MPRSGFICFWKQSSFPLLSSNQFTLSILAIVDCVILPPEMDLISVYSNILHTHTFKQTHGKMLSNRRKLHQQLTGSFLCKSSLYLRTYILGLNFFISVYSNILHTFKQNTHCDMLSNRRQFHQQLTSSFLCKSQMSSLYAFYVWTFSAKGSGQ